MRPVPAFAEFEARSAGYPRVVFCGAVKGCTPGPVGAWGAGLGWFWGLGDGDVFVEIDILDGAEESRPFVHRFLERLSSGDEAHAAGALIDDGGGDGFGEVVASTGTATVDETGAAHVAVSELVAGEVDRVVGGELGVDALVEFAVGAGARVEGFESAVIFGELLFDDVGFDGDAEVVGLSGEVGRDVVVLVFLEFVVAEVAPEDGGHAELVGAGKGFADFDDLAGGVIAAEIDGGSDGDGPHFPGLFDLTEHDLVEFVGVGHEFVVVDLDDEGDAVGVFAGDGPEDAEGGGDGVAAAFDGEFDDVFGIEVGGIFGKGGTGAMFDALVYGKDAEVAGARETSVVEHGVHAAQDTRLAVAMRPDSVHEIGAGEVELVGRDGLAGVVEEVVGLVSEKGADVLEAGHRMRLWHGGCWAGRAGLHWG